MNRATVLQQLEDIKAFTSLRNDLKAFIEPMKAWIVSLTDKLDETVDFLDQARSDNDHLREELNKAKNDAMAYKALHEDAHIREMARWAEEADNDDDQDQAVDGIADLDIDNNDYDVASAICRMRKSMPAPYDTSMVWSNWLEEFKILAISFNEPEKYWTKILVPCLSGDAIKKANESLDLPNLIAYATFEEAVQELVEVFNNTEAARTAFAMARSLTQGDKPAEEYLTTKMSAINRWNSALTDEAKAVFLAEGLNDGLKRRVFNQMAGHKMTCDLVKSIAIVIDTDYRQQLANRSGQNKKGVNESGQARKNKKFFSPRSFNENQSDEKAKGYKSSSPRSFSKKDNGDQMQA